jgi:hypothetical protein
MKRHYDSRREARTALLEAGYWPTATLTGEVWAKRTSPKSDKKEIVTEIVEADERHVVRSL